MKSVPLAVTLAVLVGLPSPSAVFAATTVLLQDQDKSQQDKNEKERKKQEDRAAEKLAKDAKDVEETLKDVRQELDELALDLLDSQYTDPFLQDYVNELGQSLVPKETPPGVLFSFRVLDNTEPNAMALPDGRIFLNSGLLVFVENEAQLAMILGHEIGHVTEQHYIKSAKSQKRTELITGIAGAVGGALLGGIFRGKKGAAEGALVGVAAAVVVARVRMNNYSRQQEDEADRVGTMLALDRRFDSREAVALFKKLTITYGERDRFSNALYGRHSRNKDRIAHVESLLAGGEIGTTYNQLRSSGSLTAGSGQMHMYASRMMRDVAISLMDDYDRYDLAKRLLERVVDYRASDPKTLWALGRVYKLVGRTDADRAKALDLLQRAAQLDQRNLYPYTHRDLGLMQARMGSTPAAAESLKAYILGHIKKTHLYPDDLEEMYDYLLTFGDRNWTAPAVDPSFIRAMAPAEPPAATVPPTPKPVPGVLLPLKPGAKPIVKPPVKKGGGTQ